MGFLKDSFKESGAALDKARPADETLKWVRNRFNSLGVPILQDTERVDKGRLGIPVYVSRYSPSVSRLTGTPRQMGKGATPAQAEASAVMELVERFSLFNFVKEREHRTCRRMDLNAGAVPLKGPGRLLLQMYSRKLSHYTRLKAKTTKKGARTLLHLSGKKPLPNQKSGSQSTCWPLR